jgi:hypothetical protein
LVSKIGTAVALLLAAFVLSPSGYGLAQSASGRQHAGRSIPDFAGVWERRARQGNGRIGAVRNLASRPDTVVGDYRDPILRPWASAIVKQHGDMELAGFAAPETKLACWPGGVPNMLSIPSSLELLQTPGLVTIIFSNDHQVRFVYLNKPHSAHITPSWYGESVGHYEGNVLVVDTIGVVVKPMSMVDVFGTPHTDALHVVERFQTDADGKALRVDIRVEDPGTFTAPWSAIAMFYKSNYDFEEYVCAENNVLIGIDQKSGEMPRAKYVAPF